MVSDTLDSDNPYARRESDLFGISIAGNREMGDREMSEWHGPLYVSKRFDPDAVIVVGSDVAYESFCVYWEKQALIESLEKWLATFQESPCAPL